MGISLTISQACTWVAAGCTALLLDVVGATTTSPALRVCLVVPLTKTGCTFSLKHSEESKIHSNQNIVIHFRD